MTEEIGIYFVLLYKVLIYILYNKMVSDFIINPCKSCMNNLDSENYDVNQINQYCNETLKAFNDSGIINPSNKTSLVKNCVECVNQAIKRTGKNTCDLKIQPSVLWGNSPHFFPNLLNEMKDVKKAYKECKNMCLDTLHPNECVNACTRDMNAVEIYKGNKIKEKKIKERKIKERKIKEKKIKEKKIKPCTSNQNIYFDILIIVLIVVFIIANL